LQGLRETSFLIVGGNDNREKRTVANGAMLHGWNKITGLFYLKKRKNTNAIWRS
jgi:hypothetical protein